MIKKILIVCYVALSYSMHSGYGQARWGWYTEGHDFAPEKRIRISVTNVLDMALPNQPVIVKRTDLPVQNIPERWIAVIDP